MLHRARPGPPLAPTGQHPLRRRAARRDRPRVRRGVGGAANASPSIGPSCSRPSPCSSGADRAVASAARTIGPEALATSLPYLQPLALSAATRKRASKSLLEGAARERVVAATDVEPVPLERLVRVKPRTLMTIAALVGAFYLVLPQLANVDDSFAALDTANWGWLAVCRGDVRPHLRRRRPSACPAASPSACRSSPRPRRRWRPRSSTG